MLELGAAQQVTRVSEVCHQPAIDLHRAPSDMIDVKVRAHNDVDRLTIEAGACQRLEERQFELLPEAMRWAFLVIADVRVDDDPRCRGRDHQSVKGEAYRAVTGDEVRPQPVDGEKRLLRPCARRPSRSKSSSRPPSSTPSPLLAAVRSASMSNYASIIPAALVRVPAREEPWQKCRSSTWTRFFPYTDCFVR